MARLADLKVLAPLSLLNGKARTASRRRQDGDLEVLHPRWLHIPGTGALSALLLFMQMLFPALALRRRFGFDFIDAHFGYPEGIAAALLSAALGRPFTITLRGAELLHSGYPLRRWLMSWAMRRARIVITVSEQLRQLAVRLGAASVVVIPNGLDSSIYYPRDREQMRAKHGLRREAKIILTAGHLIKLKGHQHAVAALAQLRRKGIDAELWIAGGHPGPGVPSYETEIRRQVGSHGLTNAVRFLGHLPQQSVAELMSAADIFCLASSREGWPNVVVEALGCGTPVVATRVGAIPEILFSETLGLLVPPGDAEAMALAWERALAASWDRDAFTRFARGRCWNQVAREVIDCMHGIDGDAAAVSYRSA
jgi:glycosyltransferase involved in cell wall biosynthesis